MICAILLFLGLGFIGVVFIEAASLPNLKLLVDKDSKPDPSLPSESNKESAHNRLK